MHSILIAQNEPRVAALLASSLHTHGFEAVIARSREQTLTLACGDHFDLLVIDFQSPDKGGLSVLETLQSSSAPLPTIALVAREAVDAIATGHNSHLSDFVIKPFRFTELLARIRLRLRKRCAAGEGALTVLRSGDIVLDLCAREARVGGRAVELTPREFVLAEAFLRNAGRVLGRDYLLSNIWGYDYDPGSNIVDVYVRHLRIKLCGRRLETIRGLGYRLS
ncbi:response regulator transcription factor [Gloeobacter morelensis]|uniref:Response regulator transcription factor n=1 Tax=Gloeobacter morelensis MG652769 TaxID=2781736 RepID=A0ABY3PTB6_9CYAN|nr:response regulator transcription factor [Gloeobacter morelensis]UFP96686.1 response regulator transcription factor [Gloeobacter morelensis MG652769]